MGAMQFFAPILAKNYEGGYASAGFFRTLAPVGIVISILLTLLAVIGIWEKDQPKYFGIGGEKTEKIKVSEYIQIIKNNDPMQRLMVLVRAASWHFPSPPTPPCCACCTAA